MTSMCVCKVTSVLSDRLPCPWDSPGKNTGVGCHFLLQGIFLTQGSNPGLLCLLQWQVGSLAPVAPGEPPQRQPDESKNYLCSLAPQKCLQSIDGRKKKKKQNLLNIQEKEMTDHSSFLPWRIPWNEEPGGYSPFQFSRSVVSDSLRPHGLQNTRLPCPSPTPRACSNSCPLRC